WKAAPVAHRTQHVTSILEDHDRRIVPWEHATPVAWVRFQLVQATLGTLKHVVPDADVLAGLLRLALLQRPLCSDHPGPLLENRLCELVDLDLIGLAHRGPDVGRRQLQRLALERARDLPALALLVRAPERLDVPV